MVDPQEVRSILSEGLIPNPETVENLAARSEGPDAGESPAPAPEGQAGAPGKPEGEKAATPAAAPAESGADTLASEYGALGDLLGESPTYYQETAATLAKQVEELRHQVEYFQQKASNKLASLSEEEINARAQELREEGKNVEAEKLVRDWMNVSQETPEQYLSKRGSVANLQLEEYFKAQPALRTLLNRPDISRALYRWVGLLNMDRPGAPQLLHAAVLGLCWPEIARKAEERGRQSVRVTQPKTVNTGTALNPPAARNEQGQFRPRKTLSDQLLEGLKR